MVDPIKHKNTPSYKPDSSFFVCGSFSAILNLVHYCSMINNDRVYICLDKYYCVSLLLLALYSTFLSSNTPESDDVNYISRTTPLLGLTTCLRLRYLVCKLILDGINGKLRRHFTDSFCIGAHTRHCHIHGFCSDHLAGSRKATFEPPPHPLLPEYAKIAKCMPPPAALAVLSTTSTLPWPVLASILSTLHSQQTSINTGEYAPNVAYLGMASTQSTPVFRTSVAPHNTSP